MVTLRHRISSIPITTAGALLISELGAAKASPAVLLSQGNCFSGTRHRECRGANMPVVTASPGLLRRRHCHLICLGLPLRFSSHFLGKRAQAPLPPQFSSFTSTAAVLAVGQWTQARHMLSLAQQHTLRLGARLQRQDEEGCSSDAHGTWWLSRLSNGETLGPRWPAAPCGKAERAAGRAGQHGGLRIRTALGPRGTHRCSPTAS